MVWQRYFVRSGTGLGFWTGFDWPLCWFYHPDLAVIQWPSLFKRCMDKYKYSPWFKALIVVITTICKYYVILLMLTFWWTIFCVSVVSYSPCVITSVDVCTMDLVLMAATFKERTDVMFSLIFHHVKSLKETESTMNLTHYNPCLLEITLIYHLSVFPLTLPWQT